MVNTLCEEDKVFIAQKEVLWGFGKHDYNAVIKKVVITTGDHNKVVRTTFCNKHSVQNAY